MSPLYYIELASIKSLIFDTFMDHLVSLHVFTVCLVPCVIWPLLASCSCQEFSDEQHVVWCFVRLAMFAKLLSVVPLCWSEEVSCDEFCNN